MSIFYSFHRVEKQIINHIKIIKMNCNIPIKKHGYCDFFYKYIRCAITGKLFYIKKCKVCGSTHINELGYCDICGNVYKD